MKVGLPIFMPTADELLTVQRYGHENGESRFRKKITYIQHS